MTELEAIGRIGWIIDYYDLVHDSQCNSWKKGHHENIKYCTCDTGKAYFKLYEKVIGKKYVKT